MVRNHCLYFTLKMNLLDVYKSKSNSHVNLHNHTIKAKRKCSKKKKKERKKEKEKEKKGEKCQILISKLKLLVLQFYIEYIYTFNHSLFKSNLSEAALYHLVLKIGIAYTVKTGFSLYKI